MHKNIVRHLAEWQLSLTNIYVTEENTLDYRMTNKLITLLGVGETVAPGKQKPRRRRALVVIALGRFALHPVSIEHNKMCP
jgi:hypothetical protein